MDHTLLSNFGKFLNKDEERISLFNSVTYPDDAEVFHACRLDGNGRSIEHYNCAIGCLVDNMESRVVFTIRNIIPRMRNKRENYIASDFVIDHMFLVGPLLMVVGDLIETCEVVVGGI